MNLIQNFSDLAVTEKRRITLEIVEAGLAAIQPKTVLEKSLVVTDQTLKIGEESFVLSDYERIFLVGFGKGSAAMSQIIEKKLGDLLTAGYVIDTKEKQFEKIEFSLGTHPLPSQANIDFTEKVLTKLSNLNETDLVLVVVCGGGSALFESPFALNLPQLEKAFETLLKSGATITENNTVRKHLSKVKGGGLARHLYPAKIAGLIFSDVPGNDLSVIASGPTTRDSTTMTEVYEILDKYKIDQTIIPREALTELTQELKYFEQVKNMIILSNMTALTAMQRKAEELGQKCFIYSDKVQGEANVLGAELIAKTPEGQILLAGGETTVHVTGSGRGGRNQTLVLATLPQIDNKTIVVSIDSDGIDYDYFAGAIGDQESLRKAETIDLIPGTMLMNNDSLTFFEKIGDGILTDKLESNVSDLIMIAKI